MWHCARGLHDFSFFKGFSRIARNSHELCKQFITMFQGFVCTKAQGVCADVHCMYNCSNVACARGFSWIYKYVCRNVQWAYCTQLCTGFGTDVYNGFATLCNVFNSVREDVDNSGKDARWLIEHWLYHYVYLCMLEGEQCYEL